MRVRVPASSANLGPGFDTLAVALGLYVEVEVTAADQLSVTAEGEGSEFPADRDHLAAVVARSVVGHDRLAISVRSEIPPGRGLGSSAALAVAAAAAAGAADPLAVAAAFDGHPENAAASAIGGLVAATTIGGTAVASSLTLDPQLRFVVVVPDRSLSTHEARRALPDQVGFADAVFNLGRMGLLVAGLAEHRLLRSEATADRLHQDYRALLFPEAPALLQGLVSVGALASCWSGAGPSLLGICEQSRADEVAAGAVRLLDEVRVPGQVMNLAADRGGLVLDWQQV